MRRYLPIVVALGFVACGSTVWAQHEHSRGRWVDDHWHHEEPDSILDRMTLNREHRPSLVENPKDYPRIPAFQSDDETSFWYSLRPNLIGQEITDEWDFYSIIATDRPDFTDAPYTVGAGVVYVESGYTFLRTRTEDGQHINRRQLPEVLLRVGLTDEFEFRARWNGYVMYDAHDPVSGATFNDFGGQDVNVGFKYEIFEQEGWRPLTTLLCDAFIPTGTRDISSNTVQPRVNGVLGWGLRRWAYLKVSAGADFLTSKTPTLETNGEFTPLYILHKDSYVEGHGSIALLLQISKRMGTFLEYFSLFRRGAEDNRPDHFADTGIYYYLTPNVQLDIRIGHNISERNDILFTGAGFSIRY